MPTPTYIPLATVTLGSSASSVTFSSIPATFRDLVVVTNGSNSANAYIRGQFNGDTASNYSTVDMFGFTNPGSSAFTAARFSFAGFSANQRHGSITQILDYSATDKHKTLLNSAIENENGLVTTRRAIRYASTSAITSIRLFVETGNINVGATFSLYGIAS